MKLSIPGANLEGVHYLRTVDDALSLYQAIAHAQRAIVIGASFLGWRSRPLSQQGVATTLIAKEDLVYEKLCSPEVSDFFAGYFRARGVDFIFGEEVKEFWGTAKVEGIVTSSGKRMPCDIVAVGIGVRPEVDFLGQQCHRRGWGHPRQSGSAETTNQEFTRRGMSQISIIRSRAPGTARSTGIMP